MAAGDRLERPSDRRDAPPRGRYRFADGEEVARQTIDSLRRRKLICIMPARIQTGVGLDGVAASINTGGEAALER